MGKYIVTSGQNLYDIALHIYGSIEGIVDLMMNNSTLSLCDVLKNGDELEYTDDYIINPDVVAYNRMNGIIPSNSERNVYPKNPTKPAFCEIQVKNNRTFVEMSLQGTASFEIDWGDNSRLESVELFTQSKKLYHVFDNQCSRKRIIRIYGTGDFRHINWNSMDPLRIYPSVPVAVETLHIENISTVLDFLSLMKGTHTIHLNNSKIQSLMPIIPLTGLRSLDLSGARISRIAVDEYLISLVDNYDNRRNAKMIFPIEATGEYRRPSRDASGRFNIRNGMEAMWVIVHEPAWNEAGKWVFQMNNQIYTDSE